MKKKLILGMLTAALVMAFTACSNGSKEEDKGTRPVIDLWFIVNNDTTVNANNLESVSSSPVTTVTVYPNNTPTANIITKYKEVIAFKDPDKDVVKIEFSFDNFTSTISTTVEQTYESLLWICSNQYYLESFFNGNQSTTYSVRVTDSKGNVSEPKSFTLHKATNP